MPLEPIGTAPQTGAFIILHDEETGVYEVARWLKAEGRWSQEGGDSIGINPTHWTYFPEGHGSRAPEGGEATRAPIRVRRAGPSGCAPPLRRPRLRRRLQHDDVGDHRRRPALAVSSQYLGLTR